MSTPPSEFIGPHCVGVLPGEVISSGALVQVIPVSKQVTPKCVRVQAFRIVPYSRGSITATPSTRNPAWRRNAGVVMKINLHYLRAVHTFLLVLLCLNLFAPVQDVTAFKSKKILYGKEVVHALAHLCS